MSIIISKQGHNAQKLEKSDFEKEDYLQNYIHNNPESIPIYELKEDKRLFVAKREFPTNAGPIDALAMDKDGDIYIIETKLYKNPDKRTVVAQALDYGAALWKHFNDFNEFTEILNQETQKKFNLAFQEKIEQFFNLESEQSELTLDAIRKNLNEGNIKFVILMDSIDERLKDLIIYINQNSQFDIYAVQLEYYKFEQYEIMIPKLFGVEVKKNIRTNSSQRRKWTKEEFLRDAKEKSASDTYKAIEDLLEFSYKNADRVAYGSGNKGCFSYKLKTSEGEITPMLVYSGGEIYASLGYLRSQNKIPSEFVDDLIEKFKKIKGMKEVSSSEQGEPMIKFSFDIQEKSGIEEMKNEMRKFSEKVRAQNK
ncbi:hypothetical protein J7J13_00855 [bacterium]|nr:hypothetical protein [bacterium]